LSRPLPTEGRSGKPSTATGSTTAQHCCAALSQSDRQRHLRRVISTARDRLRESERGDPALHPKASAGSVEEWFSAYESELGRYLVQFVRDRALAEDLLQETFHDAYRACRTLSSVGNPRAWLYGIARNHALVALRRQRRFDRAIARMVLRHEQPAAIDSKAASILNLLEQTLAPEDRALVLLRYLHGFDANELAEMTGRSAAAVRQRLSRARTRLLEEAVEGADLVPHEGSSK
jgi:RNA polymerase sigma-70 factor, ECF subfamily